MLFWLLMLSILAELWDSYRYILLQAGVIVIILLAIPNDPNISSNHYVWYRALGSLEGGLISLLLIYLGERVVKES